MISSKPIKIEQVESITNFDNATLPLAPTNTLIVEQGGAYKKVAVSEITTKIIENNVIGNSVATTLEQIIHVLEIPANFATENDMFEFFSTLNKPISTGFTTMRCYVNSVNSLSGASLVFSVLNVQSSRNSMSTDNKRYLFKNGFLKGIGVTPDVVTQSNQGTLLNYNFNATIPQYFITTVQFLNTTDTAEAFYSSLTKIN